MSILHVESVDRVLGAFDGDEDPVLAEMEARADRDGFPTVGHEVGAFLRWCVYAIGATRVFECGSGFGYSAYWLAQGLPGDGKVVLTEIDRDELTDAQSYLENAELAGVARFEHGDALDILEDEAEPFDLILLDHENERYRDGFELATNRLSPGGTIVADNVLHSWEYDPDDIVAGLSGNDATGSNSSLAGTLAYYQHVREHPEFDTCLVPLGEGLLVSTRTEPRDG